MKPCGYCPQCNAGYEGACMHRVHESGVVLPFRKPLEPVAIKADLVFDNETRTYSIVVDGVEVMRGLDLAAERRKAIER